MDFDLSAEQKMWRDIVHDFVAKEVKPKAREVDEKAEFNWPAVRKMGSLGLLGLAIPEEYGGAGVDALSAAIAIEELGWGCGSTALAIAAHNGLGTAPIVNFGTPEQKARFLPSVASGHGGLAAFVMTEPGAGSDLQGITTHAELHGDEWVLNGAKLWCTNASLAEYIIMLVRTDRSQSSRAFTMFILPSDTPGIHIAPAEKKMGLKGSPTHAITLEDVHLPASLLLGEVGRGEGHHIGARVGVGVVARFERARGGAVAEVPLHRHRIAVGVACSAREEDRSAGGDGGVAGRAHV